jgi:hypothetical protein
VEKPPETVTASEIAEWAFCAESWRSAALGHESATRPNCEAGTAHHEHKATAERVAGGFIAIGRILIVVALLAMLAALLWH